MSVPRITRSDRARPFEDGAAAFWQAAEALENAVATQRFAGDLSEFGFTKDASDDVRTRLHWAMARLHDVLPDLGLAYFPKDTPIEARDARKMEHWERDERTLFWSHPLEETLAVTQPYGFQRPYGDAMMALFHFGAIEERADQNARNARLSGLDAANQTRKPFAHLKRHDVYRSTSDGFGGTFAFAKSDNTGGRDQITTAARGFSMSKGRGDRLSAPGAPYLFLEVSFDEIAV